MKIIIIILLFRIFFKLLNIYINTLILFKITS